MRSAFRAHGLGMPGRAWPGGGTARAASVGPFTTRRRDTVARRQLTQWRTIHRDPVASRRLHEKLVRGLPLPCDQVDQRQPLPHVLELRRAGRAALENLDEVPPELRSDRLAPRARLESQHGVRKGRTVLIRDLVTVSRDRARQRERVAERWREAGRLAL